MFIFGTLLLFAMVVFTGIAQSPLPIISVIAGSVAAVALPPLNKAGRLLKHDINGYKLFLKTADKQRINWSESQQIFEKNLPYAVALGLTDKWAKVFEGKIQIPDWYKGSSTPNFNQLQKSITTSAARSIRNSTPRSTSSSRGSSGFGGGGSSGGGFGGGGGRSW